MQNCMQKPYKACSTTNIYIIISNLDVLRDVFFLPEALLCSSVEEWSSQASKTSHIFWGAFISSSLNQQWIALHYMFGSLQSHLTKTYYWRYRVIFRSFYVSICCTVINISLIYITSIRISSEISAAKPNRMLLLILCLWIKLSKFSSMFSLYQTIWVIKAWCITHHTF